jgi:hypothetical protein
MSNPDKALQIKLNALGLTLQFTNEDFNDLVKGNGLFSNRKKKDL